jgi:Zn-dependent M16 (insulinase) family peptidase
MRQAQREGVLAVGRADLQRVASSYLLEGRSSSVVSALASDEMLQQANRELENEGLEIERI